MHFMRENTADNVFVGPIIDVSDSITPLTTLTVGDITCTRIADDASSVALTLTATGGANDFVHIAAGNWKLELGTSDTIAPGRMRVAFQDDDVFLPFWEDFMVLPEEVYDSFVLGTDKLQVDIIQINGATTATYPTSLPISETPTWAALFGSWGGLSHNKKVMDISVSPHKLVLYDKDGNVIGKRLVTITAGQTTVLDEVTTDS